MRSREHTVRGRKRGHRPRRSEVQRSLRYLTWHISCVPSAEPLPSDPSFKSVMRVCKIVVKFVHVGVVKPVTSALIIQWRDSESVTLCFKIRRIEGIREKVLIFSCYKDHIYVLLMIWCVVACILRLF